MPTPTYHSGTQYSHTTFASAVSLLSSRLDDPAYWSQDELQLRIVQALRMFQSLTGFYRERAEFDINLGAAPVFDLHTLLPARFGFSVPDQELVKGIQFSLLEPATGNSWTGSTQFNLDAVSKALQRIQNQFLADTGMVLRYQDLNVPPQPVGRVNLPDDVVNIRRVWWKDADGVFPVFRDDEFSALSFSPGWPQEPGVPQIYSAAITPPVSMQLIPAPVDKGNLRIVTVNTGPTLNPLHKHGEIVGVPNDFTWALEFGVLAELLLGDGLRRDPMRAQAALALYKLAVQAGRMNPSVLMVQVNDELLYTGAISDMDHFLPNWQNTPDAPAYSAMVGRNLLALGPVPDQEYGVTVDYVPNFPVPKTDADYLQIGREDLEGVLDLAQYLCAFKQGGQEFQDATSLFQNFLRSVQRQNAKLGVEAFYLVDLIGASVKESQQTPREQSTTNATT